eukprot:363925-Chlamydomonas_euryale.AAC.2
MSAAVAVGAAAPWLAATSESTSPGGTPPPCTGCVMGAFCVNSTSCVPGTKPGEDNRSGDLGEPAASGAAAAAAAPSPRGEGGGVAAAAAAAAADDAAGKTAVGSKGSSVSQARRSSHSPSDMLS